MMFDADIDTLFAAIIADYMITLLHYEITLLRHARYTQTLRHAIDATYADYLHTYILPRLLILLLILILLVITCCY